MDISLIWAMTENGIIGKDNKLPWHIPEELNYFKKITLGKPIIMGRKTFDSLNQKPLPNRKNIILTKVNIIPNTNANGVGVNVVNAMNATTKSETDVAKSKSELVIVHSIEEALQAASGAPEVMVIGGSYIFEQFLSFATRLYVTIIHHPYEGDTYFPSIDWEQWQVVTETPGKHFSTKVLVRKQGGHL